MPKNKYLIVTPHGEITRTSDRIYSHVVYYIDHPSTPGRWEGEGDARRWTYDKLTDQPKKILDTSFAGRPDLAHKQADKWRGISPTREVFIVPATLKPAKA